MPCMLLCYGSSSRDEKRSYNIRKQKRTLPGPRLLKPAIKAVFALIAVEGQKRLKKNYPESITLISTIMAGKGALLAYLCHFLVVTVFLSITYTILSVLVVLQEPQTAISPIYDQNYQRPPLQYNDAQVCFPLPCE